MLKKNLETLTSSFGKAVSEVRHKLTPKEIEVCNMIRNGLTSKEIGNQLNLSVQTINKHRKNIRKKLDLSNKETNLASYLQNL
ncbi:MAG: response regulator transcription factor [Nitrospirae bacterium]|nr:response regulator transcription factor [Nitrospirota bacterium]